MNRDESDHNAHIAASSSVFTYGLSVITTCLSGRTILIMRLLNSLYRGV